MPRHRWERPRGRIVELEIDSPHLHENLLGDPGARTVAVYLPEGYDDSDEDYPLLVDLAGYTGSGLKRLSWTAFGSSVPQRIDALVESGAMGPVIAAFPDGFTSLGGNQYVDSIAMGRWATFIAEELPTRLAKEFRVRDGAAHRAVLGKSSGGYGAMIQAMCHGHQWGAVACHSGDLGFEWVYRRDFPGVLDTLARYKGIEGFLEHVQAAPKMRGGDFHVLMILAMAASYDPDPDAPKGIRLPVDPHTCVLDPDRWNAWLSHDPVVMIEREDVRASLARCGKLFIDCGRRDQYFLHYGARTLVAALSRYGIEHHYEEFDDDHSSVDYRLDVSLPWLYREIAGKVISDGAQPPAR